MFYLVISYVFTGALYHNRLVHVSLNQLKKMTGTFEIAGVDKDKFATELDKIRTKFKQVLT